LGYSLSPRPFLFNIPFFGSVVNTETTFFQYFFDSFPLTLPFKGIILNIQTTQEVMLMVFQISLKAARVNADLEQEEAAKEIGVTAKTLSNYERGITAIPGHLLKKAARIYKIPEENIRLPIVDDGEYDEDEFFLQHSTV
jgi:DNA-binding XRE family transcriptional regulator